jgi:hypothetical protein
MKIEVLYLLRSVLMACKTESIVAIVYVLCGEKGGLYSARDGQRSYLSAALRGDVIQWRLSCQMLISPLVWKIISLCAFLAYSIKSSNSRSKKTKLCSNLFILH